MSSKLVEQEKDNKKTMKAFEAKLNRQCAEKINAGSEILAPQNSLDGRTGGGGSPHRTPPIASAFGDNNGEIFGQISFRPKIFRQKKIRPKKMVGRKISRPKVF